MSTLDFKKIKYYEELLDYIALKYPNVLKESIAHHLEIPIKNILKKRK